MRASTNSRDCVRTFMRSRSDMVSGVVRRLRFGRSPCKLYQIRAAVILRYPGAPGFLNSRPQPHHSRIGLRPHLPCESLGAHSGGEGALNLTNLTKAGPYRGDRASSLLLAREGSTQTQRSRQNHFTGAVDLQSGQILVLAYESNWVQPCETLDTVAGLVVITTSRYAIPHNVQLQHSQRPASPHLRIAQHRSSRATHCDPEPAGHAAISAGPRIGCNAFAQERERSLSTAGAT